MGKRDLIFPESVKIWLTKPAIRNATNALLEHASEKPPAGLEFYELRAYFSALASAQLTRSEWAIAMFDLWTAVWTIPDDWEPVHVAHAKSQTTSTAECWQEDGFNYKHTRGGLELFTAVSVTPEKVDLAFSLEVAGEEEFLIQEGPEPFLWKDGRKDDWAGWNVYQLPGNIASNPEMVSQLRNAADAAVRACLEVADAWKA